MYASNYYPCQNVVEGCESLKSICDDQLETRVLTLLLLLLLLSVPFVGTKGIHTVGNGFVLSAKSCLDDNQNPCSSIRLALF